MLLKVETVRFYLPCDCYILTSQSVVTLNSGSETSLQVAALMLCTYLNVKPHGGGNGQLRL